MTPRRLAVAAYVLTFLTGSAGLIDQLVWQRYLSRLLGSDSLSTAIVLGLFLGGLSLGYRWCGNLAVRSKRLFRAYGLLEIAIGIWALAFPLLFAAVERWVENWEFSDPWGHVLQGTLASAVLIGVPTICMGGTVPFLTRGLSRTVDAATGVHSRVYAINTLGACAGCLIGGFVLIHRLGLPSTLRLAGVLNLLAAVFFLRLDSSGIAVAATPEQRPRRTTSDRSASRWVLPAIAFLGGFSFMTLESLLVRLARISLGSSSASLTIVIAVFVLCVAAGALWVARRPRCSSRTLLTNQLLVAAGLLALFPTLDLWPYLAHLLRTSFPSFPAFHAAVFVALLAVLALPVGCMGATLPLTFHLRKRGLDDLARAAGSLFSWNAAGNLLGGVIGGYVLFRYLGSGEVFLVVLATAVLALLLAARGSTGRSRILVAALIVACVAVGSIFPFDPTRFGIGLYHLRETLDNSSSLPRGFYREFYSTRTLLAYRDNPQGTFAVVENLRPAEAMQLRFPRLTRRITGRRDESPRPRSILVNGKPDSSTYYDRETLKLLAHLPGLLAPRRDRVLVVGLGTGVTAGEFSLYRDLGSIEVAEIAPAVVDFLPFFEASNHGIHDDPRMSVHTGDAFRVLRRRGPPWDIISSEPSNPWVAGVDQLFSREFYRRVREHLAPDGLFLQWAQRYSTSESIAAIVANTLRSEFPHVRLFRSGEDNLYLASLRPVTDLDLERARLVLNTHVAVGESLREVGVEGVDDLLARERPEELVRAAELRHLGLETLDRPRIHHLSVRALFRGEWLDAEQTDRTR